VEGPRGYRSSSVYDFQYEGSTTDANRTDRTGWHWVPS
jgi:hypothetical protein